MVEYTITKKTRKQQINTWFFKAVAGLLVILAISLLISVYFLVIGYVDDANARGYGYGLLACVVFSTALIMLRYYFLIRKAMSNFDAVSKDGQIVMRFENKESQYVLSNLTTGNSFTYEKSSIGKVKYFKNMIVLYINGGRTEFLPNTDEVRKIGEFDII